MSKKDDLCRMLEKAQKARDNAHAPYSKFKVGACIKTSNGNLYSGCNIENLSNGLSICAEAGAICQMINSGERHITDVLVLVNAQEPCPCCGACLQRLEEFCQNDILIHLQTTSGMKQETSLRQLFPQPFTPNNVEQT